jgi:hypothetical protein
MTLRTRMTAGISTLFGKKSPRHQDNTHDNQGDQKILTCQPQKIESK